MSVQRRKAQVRQQARRLREEVVRRDVVDLCGLERAAGLPKARVARRLALSERTLRHWEQKCTAPRLLPWRGRRPRCATRLERCQVCGFLREHGAQTPLAALRAAFPQVSRSDLQDLLRRYRRIMQRKAQRYRSRLRWHRPGAVWGADFKEPREPLEGRYTAILSVRDLASRYQLAWQPVEEAAAQQVQDVYARLFSEQGPPLVMKSDNGGPFRAEETKRLLAAQGVTPLYNPKRRPSYNGAVERANGQLTGYQEALAEFRGRAGMPTCDDAESARRMANDLARPDGWRAPTAGQLWAQRVPLTVEERAGFLASVAVRRAQVRAQLGLPADEPLGHYPQAAVDRRAVRDALLEQGLLTILPAGSHRGAGLAPGAARRENDVPLAASGCTMNAFRLSDPPAVGGSAGLEEHQLPWPSPPSEEVHSSAHTSTC
jgi:transposase InsO family protein